MKNSVEVLKKQIFLAEAQHVFTRAEFSNLKSDLTSEKLFRTAVNPMQSTYSLQIYQSLTTQVL